MTNPAHTLRIEALAYYFDNASKPEIDEAAANLANGCPAFWHRASGGNAVVGGFITYLNQTQDVQRAWAAFEQAHGTKCRARNPKYLFEILPLNRAAAQSLAEAYDEVSVFHTASELLSRTYDAEGKAVVALETLRHADFPVIGIDVERVNAAQVALVDHRAELNDAARDDLRTQLAASLEVV